MFCWDTFRLCQSVACFFQIYSHFFTSSSLASLISLIDIGSTVVKISDACSTIVQYTANGLVVDLLAMLKSRTRSKLEQPALKRTKLRQINTRQASI